MKDFLKKSALFLLGATVSVLIGAEALGAGWPTPGQYLGYRLFPPWRAPGSHNFGAVLLVHTGTDAVCCFVLLWIAYGLFRKVSREVKK